MKTWSTLYSCDLTLYIAKSSIILAYGDSVYFVIDLAASFDALQTRLGDLCLYCVTM